MDMKQMKRRMREQRYRLMKRLESFTSNHPFIGPSLWILSIQYFIVQVIVAKAWPMPYMLKTNVISDLGARTCGMLDDKYVCSPLAWLMNISFVIIGLTIIGGSLLIYKAFQHTRVSKVAFALLFLSGLGTILVGLFQEDVYPQMHVIGAVGALLLGNIALILIAVSLRGMRKVFRLYTLLTGILCIVMFICFVTNNDLGIGIGNVERLVSYPYTLWLMAFGAYMSIIRLKN